MMICTGIGLMMLFGLSSGNWKSVWIGGLILMFGVGNLIIALLNERDARASGRPTPGPGEPL
jgi:type IV secretory pathway VirB2 component (pilin)